MLFTKRYFPPAMYLAYVLWRRAVAFTKDIMDLVELSFPQKSVSHLVYLPRYIMTFSWIKSDNET